MSILTIIQLLLTALSPITPLTYHAGSVEEGTYITHTFKLKNSSQDTLYITALRRSCGCTVTRLLGNKKVIPPGDTLMVFVKISTRGYRGVIKKYVLLYYREKNGEENFIRFTITANVEKFFDTPSAIFFSTTNIIIDTRKPSDYNHCHILGSENINPKELIRLIKGGKLKIPQHINLYVIDYTDTSSLKLVKEIRSLGHDKTYVLKGGIKNWKRTTDKSLLLCK